jgi:hypothetical protein
MPAALKAEGDGSGVLHKGGVGIVGGLGARRNATAGGVIRDGSPNVGALVWGFKSCGAMRPM